MKMPIDGETFKRLGRATAGAVSVISAYDQAGADIVALTVSSFVTLSYDPPLAMFAIQHSADSYTSMVGGKAFGVSLLAADQADIARQFARKGRDKIANSSFDHGSVIGVPLIPGALAHIECRTSQVVTSGDHAIIVGLIEAARDREGQPLIYFARRYGSFLPSADP
jgi:flavin reductase (DIM6/NTAB) family NADH-FMN oxidoreductase RutF